MPVTDILPQISSSFNGYFARMMQTFLSPDKKQTVKLSRNCQAVDQIVGLSLDLNEIFICKTGSLYE